MGYCWLLCKLLPQSKLERIQIPFCLANVWRQEAPHVLGVCSSGMNLSHPNKRPEQFLMYYYNLPKKRKKFERKGRRKGRKTEGPVSRPVWGHQHSLVHAAVPWFHDIISVARYSSCEENWGPRCFQRRVVVAKKARQDNLYDCRKNADNNNLTSCVARYLQEALESQSRLLPCDSARRKMDKCSWSKVQ